jgi:hypothetical protein
LKQLSEEWYEERREGVVPPSIAKQNVTQGTSSNAYVPNPNHVEMLDASVVPIQRRVLLVGVGQQIRVLGVLIG